jgi:hypothetical protein
VKPEYDQKQRIKNHKCRVKRKPDGIFVANELYTAGELDKFYLTLEEGQKWFEPVVIPKNKVYWFFGCRFEMEEADCQCAEEEKKKKRRSKTEKIMDDYDEGCKKFKELCATANK